MSSYPKSDNKIKPIALTPEVQAKILQYIEAGNYPSTACEASGISYDAVKYWLRKWENNDEDAQKFADFFVSLKNSISIGECSALQTLKQGGPGWQAQAWFLERRFYKKWGKKEQAALPQIDLSKKTREELQAIIEGKG